MKSSQSVEVPSLHVDIGDRGGQNKDAVQLTHSVRRKVDTNAVEEGMFQSVSSSGRVHLNMKYVACIGGTTILMGINSGMAASNASSATNRLVTSL